jgi:Na+/H+ antiporter NhaC
MSCKVDALDVLPLVFVALAPPLIAFFGAAAVTGAAEEVINAASNAVDNMKARQELVKKFIWFVFIWLLIPALQLAVTSAAMSISIYSGLAKRLAPWLLAAGFAASLASIMSYDRFFSMLNEGWREMTQFIYIMPMFLTYVIAASRLAHDYD